MANGMKKSGQKGMSKAKPAPMNGKRAALKRVGKDVTRMASQDRMMRRKGPLPI